MDSIGVLFFIVVIILSIAKSMTLIFNSPCRVIGRCTEAQNLGG